MNNTAELMDKGFACLTDKLGVIDAERFVSIIKYENFDYTLWRRTFFDQMSLEQISDNAVAYAEKHEHKGKGIRI